MKRCPTSRFLAVITAALCLSLFAVSGYAQLQTGNIYGKVQGKDGSVLPGVSVTLTGVGAPQTQVSDAQGNFRFLNLSPGSYTLKAELAGYGTSTRAGIGVRVGSNADVSMTLNPSVSESITVTAEAPLLDVRKAGTGINVTKVEMEKIPTSRDPWTVLQQAPSVQVDRMNVGGNQSGQQSVYNAKGAFSADNTWNVDGVNITDMGATGSSPTYYDFDSFEEMQITTGGSDPRVMTPGVQLNMVTKRGTNDWRGSGRYFYTPGSYQADSTVPAEASTYLSQTNAINFVRDYGAEIGGPIWRDHIWFWLADSENKISNQNALPPGGVATFDNIILRDKNAKLNGQITSSNSGVGFYTFGDKVRNARGLQPTRPIETTWRQTGPSKVYKLEDTQIIGSSLYLTGMWSKVSGGFSLIPNGGTSDSVQPFRDASGTWHNSFLFYITERPQKQGRVDGSKFFDIGTMNHELKFGFGYRDTPIESTSGWPGPQHGYVRYRSAAECTGAGITVPAGTNCMRAYFYRDSAYEQSQKYNDLYVGDTILMGNLTIQAGLRYDVQKIRNGASSVAGNPVIGSPVTVRGSQFSLPALNFGGDTRDLKWNSLSPRIGLTYALGADKKTLLRAGYNRYVSQIGNTFGLSHPLGIYSYIAFRGVDLNGDKIAQPNELGRLFSFYNVDLANTGSNVSPTRLDYGMNPPHSDEFIAGFEREVLTDFSIGVNGTYRKYNDLIERRAEKHQGKGDFFTRADYEVVGQTAGSYDVLSPTGAVLYTVKAPKVNIYDIKQSVIDAVGFPTFFVFRNRPDYTQQFYGVDLTATKRLSHKWMLRGNFSWNDWKDSCGADAVADPTPSPFSCSGGVVVERSAGSGAFGNVFINSKWSYNITGLYQLPWDFSLGGSLTGRQGYPRPMREEFFSNAAAGFSEAVFQPVGDVRFPNVYELDFRAAKDFRFANRVGVTLSADLFNVPNKRTILQRQTAFGGITTAQSDYITELQSPRVWRFGARINF
jgi:hypothetical protein